MAMFAYKYDHREDMWLNAACGDDSQFFENGDEKWVVIADMSRHCPHSSLSPIRTAQFLLCVSALEHSPLPSLKSPCVAFFDDPVSDASQIEDVLALPESTLVLDVFGSLPDTTPVLNGNDLVLDDGDNLRWVARFNDGELEGYAFQRQCLAVNHSADVFQSAVLLSRVDAGAGFSGRNGARALFSETCSAHMSNAEHDALVQRLVSYNPAMLATNFLLTDQAMPHGPDAESAVRKADEISKVAFAYLAGEADGNGKWAGIPIEDAFAESGFNDALGFLDDGVPVESLCGWLPAFSEDNVKLRTAAMATRAIWQASAALNKAAANMPGTQPN